MKYMMITNEPTLAKFSEQCGVSRIFIDLEQHGKKERQGHLDTLISNHSIDDIAKIKSSLKSTELLVRLNPLHKYTNNEIEQAIRAGADLLMLPMFHSAEEVLEFSRMVNGRVGVIPLVETYDAATSIEETASTPGVTEVFIGLNDLHIDMGLTFMFELLTNGMVDEMAQKIRAHDLPFGFGGIARVGEGIVPGELVLAEHLRLKSSSVILSRTFRRKDDVATEAEANKILKDELQKLRTAGSMLTARTAAQVASDRDQLKNIVSTFLANKQK